jgi:hypothetical protein
MDELVVAFDALVPQAALVQKLELLLMLDRTADTEGLGVFWRRVLQDGRQPTRLRAEVLKRLRARGDTLVDQVAARRAIVSAALDDSDPGLRLQAAAALADFADHADVLAALGTIVADVDQPLELRYFALTSLGRGGPRPASVATLQAVVADEVLGRTAARLLSRWQARAGRQSRTPNAPL